MLCAYFGIHAAQPFLATAALRAENDGVERKLQELNYKSQQIQHDIATFETPQGVEEQGRRHGYLKPGEKPLHIAGQ